MNTPPINADIFPFGRGLPSAGVSPSTDPDAPYRGCSGFNKKPEGKMSGKSKRDQQNGHMNISYSNELHAKYKDRTVASAEVILPLVFALGVPQSVVDIGCGPGFWLECCKKSGSKCLLGIDGNYIDSAQLAIPADCFRPMDLNRPFPLAERFDLAMSLEVVEHLTPTSTPAFLDMLVSSSRRILFSAAIPGQPGDAHINGRWPAFWIKEFAARGFVALDFIRPQIWHNETVALCYRQNILYFVAKSDYEADAELRHLPQANCLHLIDEDTLQLLLSAPESLRRCAGGWLRNLLHGDRKRKD